MRDWKASFIVLMSLAPATVFGHGGDLVPYLENGKLVTGSFNHDGDVVFEYERVFGYDFDVPEIEGPGVSKDAEITELFFDAFQKTPVLSPLNTLSYTPLALPGGYLSYWDGTGSEVAFSPAAAGVSIGIKPLVGAEGVFSAAGFSGSAFSFSTGAQGSLHQHLASKLYADNMLSLDPPEGLYLLGLELTLSPMGLTSDPIYLLYNHGLSEAMHEQGLEWVEAHLIPEPSSLLLVGFTLLPFVRWRRARGKSRSDVVFR